jgi:hypothetical protein
MSKYAVVEAIVDKVTDKAAKLLVKDDTQERWVPLSVIEDGDAVEVDEDYQDLHIAKWFLDKKGIDY